MSLEDFKNAFKKFPDQYFLFGVLDGDTLVATSVCVAVNDEILYDFFHGDKLSARKFSPITLLLKGIIEFCGVHGFRLLDLGVSTDSGGINVGLQNFKFSFGSYDNQKLTFCKRIGNA
jgi:lipid II:glycine glycyltransferase (peptidoglycan interpeptide bridge formation enzyme)